MFNKKLQRGLLFNQIEGLLIRAMNTVESESDLLVKFARVIKNDPNISHDHQIFRRYRAGECTADEIIDYFSISFPDDHPNFESYDRTALGGWFGFKVAISSLSSNFSEIDPLNTYWRYLEAYCDIEYEFILRAKSTGDKSLTQDYIFDWLLVEGVDGLAKDKVKMVSYAIRMIMHWAAILELYLELEFRTNEHSILRYVLPKAYSKKGDLYFNPSSEQLVLLVNSSWAEKKYQKPKISNEMLYRDILSRQFADPDIDTSESCISDLDSLSPDTTAIKKRFQRWGKGDLFSLKLFRENIAILNRTFADSENDLTVTLPYLLVNLFTFTQIDLIKGGFDPAMIAREFDNYTVYKALVDRRYRTFVEKGQLEP